MKDLTPAVPALAGFSGNRASQLVTGGVSNYNAGQAVAQGVVGGSVGGMGITSGLLLAWVWLEVVRLQAARFRPALGLARLARSVWVSG